MRKNNSGMCTNQEYTALTTRIFDAINESMTYPDTEDLGISINPKTHEVVVCAAEDCEKPNEWFALGTILIDGEASADAVLDLADKFCFIG